MKFPLAGVNTRRLSLADYKRIAEINSIPLYHLQGVVHVEAAGRGFNRDGLLVLLYEFHIAWRLTKGSIRARLAKAGLAVRRWGAKKYPRSMAVRHKQVENAHAIAGAKAFEFSSYALPQMMGFNYKLCGFSSAKAMVDYMLVSEANQLEVMIRFLKSTGLIDHLRKGNWPKFARGYNGKSYAKHGYDRKLRHAANMYKNNPGKNALRGKTDKPARFADQDVMKAQRWLNALGYRPGLIVDGWMGKNTTTNLFAFQKAHPELANDGKIGPHTLAALEKAVELMTKPESAAAPAGAVVVGGSAVAASSLLGGWLPWVLAGGALLIIAYFMVKYLAHRNEFAGEIKQQKNIKAGKVIEVAPFADRGHPQDALPLGMR